jgi:hypothetical protein
MICGADVIRNIDPMVIMQEMRMRREMILRRRRASSCMASGSGGKMMNALMISRVERVVGGGGRGRGNGSILRRMSRARLQRRQ